MPSVWRPTEATLDGTWTYTYDADGQLTHAVFASTNPSVPNQDLTYNYDAMGNRTSTVINGVTTVYTTNDMNEYTSVGGVAYTYDADGNLTSDGTNTYTYNSLNQLIGVNGPSGTMTYNYDALGYQVSSIQNGQQVNNLVDPSGLGNVVGQFNASNKLIAGYTYGLGLVSRVDAGGDAAYYDFDLSGNTVGISNRTGQYVNQYIYVPFGQTTILAASLPNPFTFVGQYGVTTDAGGLFGTRDREYDPATGRFDQSDPMGPAGGPNAYTYGANDPTSFVDVTGDAPTPATLATKLYGTPPKPPIGPLPETPTIPEIPWKPETIPLPYGPPETLPGIPLPSNPRTLPAVPIETPPPGTNPFSPSTAEGALALEGGAAEGELLAAGGVLGRANLYSSVFLTSYSITRFAIEHNILWAGDIYNSKWYTDFINKVVSLFYHPGAGYTVGGSCTLVPIAEYFYQCGDFQIVRDVYQPIGVPNRDCIALAIANSLPIIIAPPQPGSSGNGGGSNNEPGSGSGRVNPTNGPNIQPGVVTSSPCNPVYYIWVANVNGAAGNAGSSTTILISPAVNGTKTTLQSISAGGSDPDPLPFLTVALGNLGLIAGQYGNSGFTPSQAAEVVPTLAAYDQWEADIAAIETAGANNSQVAGDVALLAKVGGYLRAITTAENARSLAGMPTGCPPLRRRPSSSG